MSHEVYQLYMTKLRNISYLIPIYNLNFIIEGNLGYKKENNPTTHGYCI